MLTVATVSFGETLTKTFGDKRSGSVETINYHDDTVELYFSDTDTMERIHVKGLAR